LAADRVRIDEEFGSRGRSVARESLTEHRVLVAVTSVALPDDDEVAAGVAGDGGAVLPVVGVRIDLELRSGGGSIAREALREDPLIVAVLVARPYHDEVPRRVGRNSRRRLRVRGVRIDLKSRSQSGTGAVEPSAEYAGVLPVERRPDDDEIAGSIDRDLGVGL
jgi:hypothetical protein